MSAAKKPWIVETLREVAEFFEVSYATVKGEWRPARMPGEQGAWDLQEILRWRDARRKSPAAGASHEVEIDGEPVTHAKLVTLEQLEKYRTRRLKNDKAAGVLVDRLEVEREVGANYLRIKARLEAVPDELQMELPAKLRSQLRQRLESKVRLILTEIASWSQEVTSEQSTRGAEKPATRRREAGATGNAVAAPSANAAGDRGRPADRRRAQRDADQRRGPAAGRPD